MRLVDLAVGGFARRSAALAWFIWLGRLSGRDLAKAARQARQAYPKTANRCQPD